MANIVITAEGSGYKLTSNDVETGWHTEYIAPSDIAEVKRCIDAENSVDAICVTLSNGVVWELVKTGGNGEWAVDSVLGVVPADIDELGLLFSELKAQANRVATTGINADVVDSVSDEIVLSDSKYVALYVKKESGTVTTCETYIEVYDGSDWYLTDHKVTGEGYTHDNICVGMKARAIIKTAQGATSVIKATLIAK
jgi:hypothetical protein